MALRAVPEHPKFARLKALLNQPKGATLGWLESLWHFTGRFTPHGNIGKYADEQIEAWVEWNGEPGFLVSSLLQAGWVDSHAVHRLVVHDWHVHADNATKIAVKRSGKPFCVLAVETLSQQCGDAEKKVSTALGLPGAGPGAGPETKDPAFADSGYKIRSKSIDPVEEIYTVYPRKVGKKVAFKAIRAAVDHLRSNGKTERDAQVFLYEATAAFARSPAGNNGKFTPHPATWFNEGRYEDDRTEWQRPSGTDQRHERAAVSTTVHYVDPETIHSGPEYEDAAHARGAA